MLLLKRDVCSSNGTLGMIELPEHPPIYTLERPWVPEPASVCGKKGVSCVPCGEYQLERHITESWDTFALVNPDLRVFHYECGDPYARTAVLIHPANYVSELRGCIAPGLVSSVRNRWPFVGSSRDAFALLRNYIEGLAPQYRVLKIIAV